MGSEIISKNQAPQSTVYPAEIPVSRTYICYDFLRRDAVFRGGESVMSWCIGRAKALSDPIAAKLEILHKLRPLEQLEDPEGVVVPVLINAVLLVESHRAAQHQITFLDDLSRTVDALIAAVTDAAEREHAKGCDFPEAFPPTAPG